MSSKIDISLSIVSHGQINLVHNLLEDIRLYCAGKALSVEVILTLNLPEQIPFQSGELSFPIKIVSNVTPKGFAANHNAAFKLATGKFFCVVNPDIRMFENPFPCLIHYLTEGVGVVAPLVTNPEGKVEDSARRFPTPWRILRKAIGWVRAPDYIIGEECIRPDWVGGMFMLFPHGVFSEVNGFDERYFLYYEDVDLCARLTLKNYAVLLCPQVGVIHEARRSSHRSLRYAKWHLSSMARFFLSKPFRALMSSH